MGLCLSSGTPVAAEWLVASTAMVLLPTGELRQYPRPATSARVLEDSVAGEAGWFLYDADAMGFEGPVAAVGDAEELRPGEIYFVLPAEVRRHGLRREEVAALAVKASAAITKAAEANSAGGRRSRGAVAPLVFAPPEEEEETGKRRPVARRGGIRRQQQRFAPDLSAIPSGGTSKMIKGGQTNTADGMAIGGLTRRCLDAFALRRCPLIAQRTGSDVSGDWRVTRLREALSR